MYDDYDTDELEGEINVEEVVLRSLDKVDGEYVEEEKRQLNERLAEMKNLLEMRKRGEIGQKPREHSDGEETLPNERTLPANHSLLGNGNSSSRPTTPTHIRSDVVSDMANDVSPIYALPSRKRTGSAATPEAASRPEKSQRMTPARDILPLQPTSHHSTTSTWSHGSQAEPIDLTKLNGSSHAEDAAALIDKIKAQSHTHSPAKITMQGRPAVSSHQGDRWKNLTKSQSTSQGPRGAAVLDGETQAKLGNRHPITVPRSYFDEGKSIVSAKPELKPSPRMPGSWEDSWEAQQHHESIKMIGHDSKYLSSGPYIPGAHNPASLQDIVNRTSAFIQPGQSITDVMNESLDPNLPMSASYTRAANALNAVGADSVERDKAIERLLEHIQSEMGPEDRELGKPPAELDATLYPHQTVALVWMRKMEARPNKGGILADDMGLGKTVSTISLMLANRSNIKARKTNLIVGPLSLIHQWRDELTTKVRHNAKSIFMYHNTKASVGDLLKYEFVLTTYGTLAAEWNRLERFNETNSGRIINWADANYTRQFPLLHPKALWHRVILDEAQCIKNRTTKSAKSAYALKSTFRWCLTGTPMMNGVHELYSLLCFLRIKPYCNWPDFIQRFGRLFGKNGSPKSQAMEALQTLLRATTLRRSKKTKIKGEPIIVLPEKTEEHIHVELSKDERDFYKQLEEKAQVQFNRYLRDGSVGKHYAAILAQLLRMRQACCHPHLNLDVDDPVSTNPHMEEVVKKLNPEVVTRIKALDAFECMICCDSVQEPSFYAPCGHYGCSACLIKAISDSEKRNIQAGEVDDEGSPKHGSKCPYCSALVDMNNAFTYTAFQTVHMPEKLKNAQEERQRLLENGYDSDLSDDSDAGNLDFLAEDVDERGKLKDFIVPDDMDSDSDTDEEGQELQRMKADERAKLRKARLSRKRAERAREKLEKVPMTNIKPSMLRELRKQSLKSPKAYKKYFDYLLQTWQHSAKVTRCVELLQEIDATDDKTIVFSQWTLLLDLIQVAMKRAGLNRPQRYDGSMNADQRASAVTEFRVDSNINVMLVSLKAGNAGLNLTAASRVIIMDPFWNPYIEMQAIDRTYRIGQKKEVHVYRILTEATVEDRIVELQERKKMMIESALDENRALMISRLRPEELKGLLFER